MKLKCLYLLRQYLSCLSTFSLFQSVVNGQMNFKLYVYIFRTFLLVIDIQYCMGGCLVIVSKISDLTELLANLYLYGHNNGSCWLLRQFLMIFGRKCAAEMTSIKKWNVKFQKNKTWTSKMNDPPKCQLSLNPTKNNPNLI